MIRIEIPGEPHPQQRARTFAFVQGGKARARNYDPAKSRNWKAYASGLMQAAMAAGGHKPLTGAVRLRILAIFALPKSKERKRGVPRAFYLGQKDYDNIAKAVGDAGNGVLWVDDRQVSWAEVRAVVGWKGEPARVIVAVDQLTEDHGARWWPDLETPKAKAAPVTSASVGAANTSTPPEAARASSSEGSSSEQQNAQGDPDG